MFGSVFFFLQHPEFSFLLKERVCPLIIKLFSPSIKHRISSTPLEKPLYPVAVRLLRIVSVLIEKFYTLLVSCLISIFNFIDFILVLKTTVMEWFLEHDLHAPSYNQHVEIQIWCFCTNWCIKLSFGGLQHSAGNLSYFPPLHLSISIYIPHTLL